MAITHGKGALGELERLLTRIEGAGAAASLPEAARERRRGHARALLAACGDSPGALPTATLAFAAELVASAAADPAADQETARAAIARICAAAELPRIALGREALGAGPPVELPVEIAIEAQLNLLAAFAEADAASLWTQGVTGEAGVAAQAGEFDRAVAHEAAQAMLDGSEPSPPAFGRRLERPHPPAAAVIVTSAATGAEAAMVLLAAAAPVLASLLDREALLAVDQASEDEVSSALERRLARLRFDLHDGPQQDVHLLAQDLALFREQLRPIIAGDANADRLVGRLDDLEAQLLALDGDLRHLSSSVQSPFLSRGTLAEGLAALTEAFTARTGIAPETRLSGRLDNLTDSQQITLLALIREALSNIRKHSAARTVQITIASDELGVRAEIADDGSGFDTESARVRAARAGRLGLVGMRERVRMLGGHTDISSRPGGPTVISVTLPRWPSVEP